MRQGSSINNELVIINVGFLLSTSLCPLYKLSPSPAASLQPVLFAVVLTAVCSFCANTQHLLHWLSLSAIFQLSKTCCIVERLNFPPRKACFIAGGLPCAAVSLLVMNLSLWGPKLPRRCCWGWFSPINCGCSCWVGTWHIFLGMSLREDQAEQGAVQV